MLLKLAQVFIKTVNVYFRDFITASSWEKGVDRHLNPVHPWTIDWMEFYAVSAIFQPCNGGAYIKTPYDSKYINSIT